ncbi:PVC-type heme-binding CxxCH protein [Pirellulaceae bacterium SH449]
MIFHDTFLRFVTSFVFCLGVANVSTGQGLGGAGQGGQTAPDQVVFASELPRIPPLSAMDSMKKTVLKPGYELELVACEPQVVDPVAITFDERSRMYVVEMIDYSEQATESLGVIKLLEDEDGDGFYETSTVFASGLSWPTAIICFEQGVFVAAAPDILFLKDSNGDGVADVKKTIFTGFGRGNVQGLVNSFRWGLDNRIYGQTSVSGGSIQTSAQLDVEPLAVNGRDFSFDPVRLDLRSEFGGGQHGMAFDVYSNRFTCHNSDNLQEYFYEQRYEASNKLIPLPPARRSIATDGPQAEVFRLSDVEPWRILRTNLRLSGVAPGLLEGGGRASGYFTGATGVMVYRGDQMPDLYGQVFVADVGSNLVHRKRLSRSGIGWQGDRIDAESEFIASSDVWFRPVQIENGPDGCLYILDFYREVVEHPQSLPASIKQHIDLTSGRDKGRIYRVRQAGRSVQYSHDLSAYSLERLVETLDHPNGWHRETARRLLHQKLSGSSDAAARELVLNAVEAFPLSEEGRAGGLDRLSLLAGAGRIPAQLDVWLMHRDPEVRIASIRLLEAPAKGNLTVRQELYRLASDSDERVRFQLALTMSLLPETADDSSARSESIRELLTSVSSDAMSFHASANRDANRAAVGNLVGSVAEAFMKEYLSERMLARGAGQGGSNKREDGKASAKSWELLGYCFARVAMEDALTALDKEWGRAGGLSIEGGSEQITLSDEAVMSGVLMGLAERFRYDANLLKSYPELLRQSQMLIQRSVQVLLDSDRPIAERLEALKEMRWAEEGEVIRQCLSLFPSSPLELQMAALEFLGRYQNELVATGTLDQVRVLSPQVRSRVIDMLIRREEWLSILLERVKQGDLAWEEFSASQRLALQNHPSQRVRYLVAGGLSVNRQDRVAVIDDYRESLALVGDHVEGKKHFLKACSACHQLDGTGYEIGPSLAAFRYRGAEAILEHVLDPNKEVNPMYLSYNILTSDDRTLTGMLESETSDSVTLTRGGGFRDTVSRSEIVEMRSSRTSLMPEGLENQLDKQAMADLLAYLLRSR